MPNAEAVTIKIAFDAMKDADDSISEIDAMIPRLLKMKKQLLAQKEYIEVATEDAANTDNTFAANVTGGLGKGIVDFRVKLYKHLPAVSRLATDGTEKTLKHDDTAADKARAEKKRGGTGPIFKGDQFLTTDEIGGSGTSRLTAGQVEQQVGADPATAVFNGVDLVCTKKFLIGVNSVLTHPNDILNAGRKTTTGVGPAAGFVDGYTPAMSGSDSKNAMHADYIAGGKHILTNGTLRGLLMQCNENVTASAGVSAGTTLLAVGDGFNGDTKVMRGFDL